MAKLGSMERKAYIMLFTKSKCIKNNQWSVNVPWDKEIRECLTKLKMWRFSECIPLDTLAGWGKVSASWILTISYGPEGESSLCILGILPLSGRPFYEKDILCPGRLLPRAWLSIKNGTLKYFCCVSFPRHSQWYSAVRTSQTLKCAGMWENNGYGNNRVRKE